MIPSDSIMNNRNVPFNKEAEQSVLGAAFLSKQALQKICDELEEKNIINDLLLAKNYTLSLISKSYGYYMIIKKLKDLFVSDEVIEEVINNYNYDDYIFYMNKFVKKNESKYTKYSDNVRKYKMFDDLKKRGYTTSDISNLNIK